MDIEKLLENYIPADEREEKEREIMLSFLRSSADAFLRKNLTAHFTASSWIVNREKTKVLFCYHNLYDSWSWVGGHADGEKDLKKVALKEAEEETGIIPEKICDDILSLEILPVSGHMKKGEYVPSHLHYNLTFLITADEKAPIRSKADENSDVRWIYFSDIEKMSSEKWLTENVYKKILRKM